MSPRWRCSWRWYAATCKSCAASCAKCSGDLVGVAGRAVCCAGTGRTCCTCCALMQPMDVARYSCPAAFSESSLLCDERIALNVYGFYYGEVAVPVAQVDVPVRATKFLTITPSYLYYEVPPSGLNKPRTPGAGFHRHVRGEPISNRRDSEVLHSPIRDLRPQHVCQKVSSDAMKSTAIASESAIAHPLAVDGHIWKPFANYEAFYERANGGWNRDRVMAGVTLPLQKHVSFQPSYIWDNNRVRGLRDINYLQFGLIVSTK